MLNIFFLICNLLNYSITLFTININKLIRVIDKEVIHKNIIIHYEKRIKSKERIIKKIQKYKVPYDI